MTINHIKFREWFPPSRINKLCDLDKWRPLSWHLPTRLDQEINRSFVSWKTQRAESDDRFCDFSDQYPGASNIGSLARYIVGRKKDG